MLSRHTTMLPVLVLLSFLTYGLTLSRSETRALASHDPTLFQQHGVSVSSLKRISTSGFRGHRRRQIAAPGTIIDDQQNKYLASIAVGGQRLNVELDTGSSDLYLMQTGFQCYRDYDNSTKTFIEPTNHSYCNPGPTFDINAAFTPLPDIHELVCYGSGKPTFRCIAGPYGNITVQINGINVPEQTVAAPNMVS